MPNIALIWDFDGTLTPEDSTTKVVEVVDSQIEGSEFWQLIKGLHSAKPNSKKVEDLKWQHVLAMDAPIWMYSLAKIANEKKIPLNKEFFEEFILDEIKLYPNVLEFFKQIKSIEDRIEYKRRDIQIHHFIISAGLKDLIELVFPKDLVKYVFGCRYTVIAAEGEEESPESIPAFCMDETTKTRSLFEIAKGSFQNQNVQVNTRVTHDRLWVPFENIIYIGDGDTDVPALSLVRDKGGLGVAVFNRDHTEEQINRRFKNMRLDKRADIITAADFSVESELYDFLFRRCEQIRQRYEASTVLNKTTT